MAQVAQVDTDRNTIKDSVCRRFRSRCWCFTLNNYTEDDIKNLKSNDYEFIFQEETGKTGTKHLQGLLCFKNAMSLSSLKKVNERCHWEVCKNKHASINYCSKGETRTGKIFSNMDKLKNVAHDTSVPVLKKKCDPLVFIKYDMACNDPTDDPEVNKLLDEFFENKSNRDMFCDKYS